jgi:hypothetical protein
LKIICLPASVKILCLRCFVECSSFYEFTFEPGSKLSVIESSAFSECHSLRSIYFPSTVEVLDSYCMRDCSSFCTVTFESDSRLSRIGQKRFRDVLPCNQFVLPQVSLFWTLTLSLLALRFVLPHLNRIQEFSRIGTSMFSYCSSLRSICIPSGITVMDNDCFYSCSLLLTVIFESGTQLSRMGKDVFSECSSLKSISIPSSVTVLDGCCLYSCSLLPTGTFKSDSRLSRIGLAAFR